MKKFINKTEDITKELLEGYVLAYQDRVKLGAENIVVRANPKSEDKVAIVTMGGSGHEPALSGYVGEGMLDCSVVGDVFAAPGAQRVFQALQMFKRDAGILLVVLNHSGDLMSANMACIPLYKVVGAASEEGKSLDELYELGERFNKGIATLAVAMNKCTHPQNDATITDLPEGIMEIGMGQHGEGGGGQEALVSADDTAEKMVGLLMRKLQAKAGDKVLLYINGVGATTHMEMNIVFRRAYQVLEAAGVKVVDGRIAEMLTVQEQSGFQMILAKMDDDHIDYLKNHMANAPYWTTVGK